MWSKYTWLLLATLAGAAQGLVNIVNPNPILMGEAMEVKCSVESIGGLNKLVGIGPNLIVGNIHLLRKLPNNTESMIAIYNAVNAVKLYGSLPQGVHRDDITMEGGNGPTGNGDNNTDTVHVTMKVNRTDMEHVTAYMCKFFYYDLDDPANMKVLEKVFNESVTVIMPTATSTTAEATTPPSDTPVPGTTTPRLSTLPEVTGQSGAKRINSNTILVVFAIIIPVVVELALCFIA